MRQHAEVALAGMAQIERQACQVGDGAVPTPLAGRDRLAMRMAARSPAHLVHTSIVPSRFAPQCQSR